MNTVIESRPVLASIQEILLNAVAACGGLVVPADVEDVAVAAFQAAPNRFCWARRHDQIDLEKVRSSLRFLSRREGGQAVIGSTKEGWLLTGEGLGRMADATCRLPLPILHDAETWIENERARLMSEPAYEKWASGRIAEVSRSEALAFFRGPDAQESWSKAVLVQRLTNAFPEGTDLRPAIDALSRRL